MQSKAVPPELSVSAQIAPDDMNAIRAAGFRSVICNRPDGEADDQPLFDEIQQAADEAGIQACYLPVESGKVGDDDGRQFAELVERLPRPVLACRRTGMLSI